MNTTIKQTLTKEQEQDINSAMELVTKAEQQYADYLSFTYSEIVDTIKKLSNMQDDFIKFLHLADNNYDVSHIIYGLGNSDEAFIKYLDDIDTKYRAYYYTIVQIKNANDNLKYLTAEQYQHTCIPINALEECVNGLERRVKTVYGEDVVLLDTIKVISSIVRELRG
jgi:hypothetical protein